MIFVYYFEIICNFRVLELRLHIVQNDLPDITLAEHGFTDLFGHVLEFLFPLFCSDDGDKSRALPLRGIEIISVDC